MGHHYPFVFILGLNVTICYFRPISTGNIGHKMLQKMGWKEGDSLGKNNKGIQEPVSVISYCLDFIVSLWFSYFGWVLRRPTL